MARWFAVLDIHGDPLNAHMREEEMAIKNGNCIAFTWRHADMGGTWVRGFSGRTVSGMKRCRTPEQAAEEAAKMIGIKKPIGLPDYARTLAYDQAEARRERLAAETLQGARTARPMTAVAPLLEDSHDSNAVDEAHESAVA